MAVGEPVWRLPLGDEYDKMLKSDIADMLSGHLCRCTGYEPIIAAILAAASGTSARRA